ncbi:hypothetical protein KAZ66_03085 [Candidatus Woesebacteria bacterium]|nr:hypothetical protein [Candidatus Woesebacteria bacterium]
MSWQIIVRDSESVLENGKVQCMLYPVVGDIPTITIGPFGIPIFGITPGDGKQYRLLMKTLETETKIEAVLSLDGSHFAEKHPTNTSDEGIEISSKGMRYAWFNPMRGTLTNLTFQPNSSGNPIAGVIGVAFYTKKPHQAYALGTPDSRSIGQGDETPATSHKVDFHRNEPNGKPAFVFYALCGKTEEIQAYLQNLASPDDLPRAFTDWHIEFTR